MANVLTVAIGPSSFAAIDKSPLSMMTDLGIEIRPNPFGRRLDEKEIVEQLKGVDGLIAGLEPLHRGILESAPDLKAIARVGIGMSNVDLEAAEELGIKVSNTPEAPTEAVAELTLAALLSLARRLPEMDAALHDGRWEKQIGIGIRGSTALIVGFGRIGRRVAQMLKWLGAEILVCDPFITAEPQVAEWVDLEDGLRRADIILVHASGEATIIGELQFAVMKKGAILLNAGRGGLVDEQALFQAVSEGMLRGAWLDVFEKEPYVGPLIGLRSMLLTPHVGTYTEQCRSSMERQAVENLLRDLDLRGE